MTTIGLQILIFIAFRIEILAIVRIRLIEEVGLTNRNPVKLRMSSEQCRHLLAKLQIVVQLIQSELGFYFLHNRNCSVCQHHGQKGALICQTVDAKNCGNNHVDNVKDYLEEKINENTKTICENADAIEEINDNLLKYSLINETGNKIQLLMDTSTYKIKAILKDKNNNTIDTSNEIDLPMESVVLNVTYNSTDKELVITLQNGSITRVPLRSLISGLVNEDTLESALKDYVLVSDYNAAISNLEKGKADKSTIYTKKEVDQLLIDGNYNFATFELDIDTGELYLRKTDDMLLQFNIDENGYLEVII